MDKTTWIALPLALMALTINAAAKPVAVKQYSTIEQVIESDYPFEQNKPDEARIIKRQPLHLIIKPSLAAGNTPEPQAKLIIESTEKAMLFNIYKPFIHMRQLDKITVEIQPNTFKTIAELQKGQFKPLTKYNIKATVTRSQALAALQKYTGLKSLNDLIDTKPGPGVIAGESFSAAYNKITGNTRYQIIQALTKQK